MFSFKQLEALFWIAQLGGFSAAARKLNTTQSAVSKRVKELEMVCNAALFDRRHRQARLSGKGEEMLVIAKRLLEQRDLAIRQFSASGVLERRLRLGITELTAMTWLPRLVKSVHEHYPGVAIEPDADSSVALRDKLLADEVDMIIVPDAFSEPRFSLTPLGTVRSAWMCKPGLLPTSRVLRIHELATYPILSQGGGSGTGIVYDRWFKSLVSAPKYLITSNSLVALIGLTVSGAGVSYLPQSCLRALAERGALDVIRTSPALPDITYVAMFRKDRGSAFIASIIALAKQCCDFSNMFQFSEVAEGAAHTESVRNPGVDLFG